MTSYDKICSRMADLCEEMLKDNPEESGKMLDELIFSEKSRNIINELADYSERTGLYKRLEHEREEFERDIDKTPGMIYGYMLERAVDAPTKMHMISSIILLMPVLRRLLQEREDENNCDSDIDSDSIANNIPDCSSD